MRKIRKAYSALKCAYGNFWDTFRGLMRGETVMLLSFSDGQYPKEEKALREAMESVTLLLNVYGISPKEAEKLRIKVIESRIACIDDE